MSYRLSARAEADLAEVWDYSAERWSVEQADRYVDALVSRFAWLSENGALWKFKLSEVDEWVRSGGAADSETDDKGSNQRT